MVLLIVNSLAIYAKFATIQINYDCICNKINRL